MGSTSTIGADDSESKTVRRGLADAAYDVIKQSIIRCELEPGSQITEEQLAERYGISRAAVRPALKRLYQEQLVQLVTPKRYVIAPITIKHAQDLFEMRLLLEPVAANRAAGRLNDEQVQRLSELCELHYQTGDCESAAAFLRANTEFHITVARASGNEVLADTIGSLLDRAERLMNLSHLLRDRNEEAYHEHHELVDALVAGNGARAEQIMADQIQSSRLFVLEALMSSPSVQSVPVVRRPRAGADAPRGSAQLDSANGGGKS